MTAVTRTKLDLGEQLMLLCVDLGATLTRVVQYADLAEQFARMPSDTPFPESSLDYQWTTRDPRSSGIRQEPGITDEMRSDFAYYSARYAVIAFIAAFESFAIRALWVMKCYEWLRHNGSEMPAEVFYELRTQARAIASEESIYGVLGELRKTVGARMTSKRREEAFCSLYRARNCLAHRGGLVDAYDVGKKTKVLRLRWEELVWRLDGQPVSQLKGLSMREGQQLSTRLEWGVRGTYAEGDSINLSPRECRDIALTIYAYASDIYKALAASIGTLPDSPTSEPPS